MAPNPTRGGVQGTYLSTYSFGAMSALGDGARGQGSGWFGPGRAMAPSAPKDVEGRQFDFDPGFNSQVTRVAPITHRDLRSLADGFDILRLCIETRKDQVSRMRWKVKAIDEDKAVKDDSRIANITSILRRPDGINGWQDWLRPILEDMFVIDAATVYKRRDRGGRLINLLQIDGATIKPIIDDWGRTPQPYSEGGALVYPAAYQQVLKGLPAINYSTNDLLYRPRNRRVHTAYGYSQVEQIITTVNIALRRQLSTLEHFTDGNIPDMIIQTPAEWSADDIVAYQKHWDAYFSGGTARRRRAKFTPGVGTGGIHETRQIDLKGEFDEWLARLVCYAFSLSPQSLTKQMNRASADTQKQISDEEGLEPTLLWIKAWIDDVIQIEWGCPDLEFHWDIDDAVDKKLLYETSVGYTSKGMMTINEARKAIGLDPLPDPEANKAMILLGTGYAPLSAYQDAIDATAENARLMAERMTQQPGPNDPENPDDPQAGDISDPERPDAQHIEREPTQGRVAKFDAGQPRDEAGRWTSSGGSAASDDATQRDSYLTTGKRALGIIGVGVAALAVGVALHRKQGYSGFSQSYMDAKHTGGILHDLHVASVHTPIHEAERKAVATYTGASYAATNKALRLGRKPTEDMQHIDNAIAKSALSENMILHRGLNLDRSKRILQTEPGGVFVDRGYPSTTISEEVGRKFADYKNGAGSGPAKAGKEGYVLKIIAPKGTSALPLSTKSGLTQTMFTHEVLLPRSSAFKVLSVNHDTKSIVVQHIGVSTMRKAETTGDLAKSDEYETEADRFAVDFDDLEFYPPPEGDTTAADYEGYEPIVIMDASLAKAFDPSQARAPDGKWTDGGGAATDTGSKESWDRATHEAGLILKGTAVLAAASLAVLMAPEIIAAAGVATAAVGLGEAAGIAAATAGLPFVTSQAEYIGKGYLGSAAYQAGLSIAKSFDIPTADIEKVLAPIASGFGVVAKAAKSEDKPDLPIAKIKKAIKTAVNASAEELWAETEKKAPEDVDADHKAAVKAGLDKALADFNKALAGIGKVEKAWGGYRRPEPVPFDRPATVKAEAGIISTLQTAFAAVAKNAIKRYKEVNKADGDEGEDLEPLRNVASALSDHLGDVAGDASSRGFAQIGSEMRGDIVNQVNERAVQAARERGAEMVGMHWEGDELVPSDNPDMAITETTRLEIQKLIADGLANNLSMDEIAQQIETAYAFSSDRASLIAATEISRANSEGAKASYEAVEDLGVTVLKEWIVADNNCCDICEGNRDAGPISLDQVFPSGDDTPPGHPNCRCSLSPVVSEAKI